MIESKHMQNAATGTGITAKTGTSFLPFCVVHCEAVGDKKKKDCLTHIVKIIFASYCKGYHIAKTMKEFSIFNSVK